MAAAGGAAAVDPILCENEERFCLFPIRHPSLWAFYTSAKASFWTAQEIDLEQDKTDWTGLRDEERKFIPLLTIYDGTRLEVLRVMHARLAGAIVAGATIHLKEHVVLRPCSLGAQDQIVQVSGASVVRNLLKRLVFECRQLPLLDSVHFWGEGEQMLEITQPCL